MGLAPLPGAAHCAPAPRPRPPSPRRPGKPSPSLTDKGAPRAGAGLGAAGRTVLPQEHRPGAADLQQEAAHIPAAAQEPHGRVLQLLLLASRAAPLPPGPARCGTRRAP